MNDTSLRLYEARREELENAELWKKMRIDFRLEAFKFPDSKIYGMVDIIPESSRQLIKTLVLVVNKTNRIEFNPRFTHLSASGFNIQRKGPSVYVEAIPYNDQWATEKKVSKICFFFFTGESFVLTPRINFEWIEEEINLRIQWYHIGDKYAQKYVLYLDDAEVQYIRQKIIADAFDVRIRHFEPEKKHTIQLAARLNNGKETYRSDLIEFIVPNRQQINDENMEFITVSNDPIPPNLPAHAPTENDIIEEDFNPNERTSPPVELPKAEIRQTHQPLQQQKRKSRSKMPTCCNHVPHQTFPGIEHYFRNASKKSSASSSDEHTSNDDDDNDVIIPTM